MISLKLIRTYFHLHLLERIHFPTAPVVSTVVCFPFPQVQTIKIDTSTALVPPATFPVKSAVTRSRVVITILRRELRIVVPRKRITRIAF
jgi:hypothetical protein